jgi:hypothetical protein
MRFGVVHLPNRPGDDYNTVDHYLVIDAERWTVLAVCDLLAAHHIAKALEATPPPDPDAEPF